MSFDLATFTLTHVVISLVGLGSGFVVMYGLLAAKRLDLWTALFLITTVLTSVTGFLFPADHFTPGHAIGILSLIVLTLAILGRYAFRLAGAWRAIYVISAVVALYFNVFVLIVQTFMKVSAFKELAPTQTEPPFVAAQAITLALFVAIGIIATIRFRGEPARQTAVV